MINVTPVPKPATFDAKCKVPGDKWVAQNPKGRRKKGTKLPSHWTPFLADLANGFNHLCGYAAMHTPTGGQVDHYIAQESDELKAYEWENYRFASGTMNNIKRRKDDKVLDPYTVPNGWFEVTLPDLQMRLTPAVPCANKRQAEYMLKEMKLRDDERIIRWRRSWYQMYELGELTLEGLRRKAPLIAEAVDRRIAGGAAR